MSWAVWLLSWLASSSSCLTVAGTVCCDASGTAGVLSVRSGTFHLSSLHLLSFHLCSYPLPPVLAIAWISRVIDVVVAQSVIRAWSAVCGCRFGFQACKAGEAPMKNLYLVLGNYDIDPKVRGGNLLLKPGLLMYLCCLVVSGVFSSSSSHT